MSGNTDGDYWCTCNACDGKIKFHARTIKRHFIKYNDGLQVSIPDIQMRSDQIIQQQATQQIVVNQQHGTLDMTNSAGGAEERDVTSQSESENDVTSQSAYGSSESISQASADDISDGATRRAIGLGAGDEVSMSCDGDSSDESERTASSRSSHEGAESDLSSLSEMGDDGRLSHTTVDDLSDGDEAEIVAGNADEVPMSDDDSSDNSDNNEEDEEIGNHRGHEGPAADRRARVLNSPLYEGSTQTVRHGIEKYLKIFTTKMQSKSSLTVTLQATKSLLPIPNGLPDSYSKVRSLLADELLTVEKIHVCINDCILFRGQYSRLISCPMCGEARYKAEDTLNRRDPRRTYTYACLQRSLELLFGSANIAQVMQSAGGATFGEIPTSLTDIIDTQSWREWTADSIDDVDEPSTKVILALNTDGVNPYHSQGIQYSLWPIILCFLNLPKQHRNKSYAVLLTGIVPSRNPRHDGGSLEPNLNIYSHLLVDELLRLSSTYIYSAYANAPITVKVRLLVFMMDFQGYAKFFNMSGANSYYACNVCNMRSTRKERNGRHKMVMLGHNSDDVATRDFAEEVLHRQAYDRMHSIAEQKAHAKTLGVKGAYPVMRLPYHNRIDATIVDGMHTIKDVACNIMDAVLSNKGIKVRSLELGADALTIADGRYNSLVIPPWLDLPKQSKMISSPRNLKSHDWMQLVHHRILQYCLQDLHPLGIEMVLLNFLDCVSELCCEKVDLTEWDQYLGRLDRAVKDFERCFPMLMTVTTHLVVHIGEQMKKYGPLHSTCDEVTQTNHICYRLYAYERLNSWISGAIKSRVAPESCVMETYVFHDWVSRIELNDNVRNPWSEERSYRLVGEVVVQPLPNEVRTFLIKAGIGVPVHQNTSVASNILVEQSERSFRCGKGSVCKYMDDGDVFYETRQFIQSGQQFFAVCFQLLSQNAGNERFKYVKRYVENKYVLLDKLSKPLVYFRRPEESDVYIVNDKVI